MGLLMLGILLLFEVGGDDVGFWPYSVGLLVKFCSF